jgi:hypothetical protein
MLDHSILVSSLSCQLPHILGAHELTMGFAPAGETAGPGRGLHEP